MDEESLQQNLSTLEEMILDEEKLVTYLSLSKDLCLHVNSSKTLLHSFAEKMLKKKLSTKLNIKYVISGLCEDGGVRTMVCSQDNLDKTRSEFKVVFYEHIYSVCKGNAKVDEVAFTLVNKFEDFSLCYGLIKNIHCVKRSSDEMGSLKTISQEIIKQPLQKAQSSKAFFGNKKPKEEKKDSNNETLKNVQDKQSHNTNGQSISNKSDKINGTSSKIEKPVKTEQLSPNKNQTSAKTISPKKSHTSAKQKPEIKNQKGIAGFFSKQNSPPKKTSKDSLEIKRESDKTMDNNPVKKEMIKEEKMDVDQEEKTPVQKRNGHKNGTESKIKAKPNKLNQIKKTAKVDKKRKRVLHVSDSESDAEKDDPFVRETVLDSHESEDEIPPTPNVNTVKITSGIVNPKKKRKIVDKTYTDEDGYILTKKEEVYESCSEHEDEMDSKENMVNTVRVKKESPKEIRAPAKASKKKISPPQKGKQVTLMNFFQKK